MVTGTHTHVAIQRKNSIGELLYAAYTCYTRANSYISAYFFTVDRCYGRRSTDETVVRFPCIMVK